MTTVNQGMSVEETKQIMAQRVANAIEAIAIYETKTSMTREAMSQTKRLGDKVAEIASNKRKWEGDCRTLAQKAKPMPSMAKQKAEVTSYECGNLGHYRRKCPLLKFLNHVDKYWEGKARKDSNVMTSNANI
nr:hypothetical protein [Tanacetum cinerariifolium]